jgi:hypothetical protein
MDSMPPFDIHYSIFDIYPPLVDSLFQEFLLLIKLVHRGQRLG